MTRIATQRATGFATNSRCGAHSSRTRFPGLRSASRLLALVLLGLGVCAGEVRAQSEDSLWTREKLFGDMGGLRSALGKRGVSLDLRLSQYYQNLVDGGIDTGDTYGAVMDYIVNVNGEKLGLWKGLFLNLKAETQFGSFDSFAGKPGAFAFTNSQLLYPLPGQSRTDITGWTIAQFLTKDLMVYGGKLNTFDLQSGFFPFQESGAAGFFNTNLFAPALPWLRFVELSMLGGGIQKNGPRGLEYGAIAYDPTNRSVTNGDTYDNLFEDVAGLVYYRYYFDARGGLPGALTFGFGGSTKAYASLDPPSFEPGVGLSLPNTDSERGAWALTGYYDQILWQAGPKGKRNIRFFSGMTFGSSNPGLASWSGFGTFEFTGYFASRPKDRIGVGGFYNNLARGLVDATGIIGDPLQDTSGFEAYYNAEVTPWFHVTANLQFINSATPNTDTSIIPGVRVVMDF